MAGRTDEYGNSVPHGTTGTGVYDTTGTTGHATGDYGIDTGAPVTKQVLRRSGSSSSSSSSEDDGMGGRRKKGLKEKIKQKLPGGHKTDEYGGGQPARYGHFTTTTTHTEPEKKGFGEKIKKKLPGGHKTDEYGGGPPAGYGHPTTTTIHTKPEKKGFEEMILETEKKGFEEMFEEMILETEKKGFEEMILEMAEMIKEITPGSHN